MSETQIHQERRSEVRRRVPATRISWTRENGTETCSGWMSDIATCSVAFVTPTRNLPAPGETIELTFNVGGRQPQRRAVRVARTEPRDRFFSIVACQTDGPVEQSDISDEQLVGVHAGK